MRARAFLLVLLIGVICMSIPSESADEDSTYRVLVTAAHVGELDGYTRVFVEEDTDYAIHVRTAGAISELQLDDTVHLADTEGTVADIQPYYFTVHVKDIVNILPGVSGSPVYHGTNPIGFISGWNGDGTLRCIFY